MEFVERRALPVFQVSLLTPLPLRDALEVADVPADTCGERRRALLDANDRSGVFERYFPMFRPGEGLRTVRKGLVFLMDDCRALSDPHHRHSELCRPLTVTSEVTS